MFVEIITMGIGALEFAVLSNGSIDATIHQSLTEIRDQRAFRRGRLLLIQNRANSFRHFAQVRPRRVIENHDQVVIAHQPLFQRIEPVDSPAMRNHRLPRARLIRRNCPNIPTISIVLQVRRK